MIDYPDTVRTVVEHPKRLRIMLPNDTVLVYNLVEVVEVSKLRYRTISDFLKRTDLPVRLRSAIYAWRGSTPSSHTFADLVRAVRSRELLKCRNYGKTSQVILEEVLDQLSLDVY